MRRHRFTAGLLHAGPHGDNPTIDEMRQRLAEGTLLEHLPPGVSFDEFLADAGVMWRRVLAERLGFALSRIARCEISEGVLERKLAIHVTFDPPLTESEERRYRDVLAKVCLDFGGRPPIIPGSA